MNNFKLIGQGFTADIYLFDNCAYKIYHDMPEKYVKLEAANQKFAREAGLLVPEVYETGFYEEKPYIKMEYIPGTPVIYPKMDKNLRKEALDKAVKTQMNILSIDGKGLNPMKERMAYTLNNLEDEFEPELYKKILNRFQSLDFSKSKLCHGDFHFLNQLSYNNEHWVIDWIDATAGTPEADVCRTYLTCLMYIKRLSGVYLKAVLKYMGADKEDILKWMPVVAAYRLREKTAQKEKGFLLSLIEEN